MDKYHAQKKERELKKQLKKQQQKKQAQIAPPPGWDDAHMVFMTLCLAALLFSLSYQAPPKHALSGRSGRTAAGGAMAPILSSGRDDEDDTVIDDDVVVNGVKIKNELT